MNRAALVSHARQRIALGSKSFAASSALFDRATRERAWLLYAWCRACDDIADGQNHGGALKITDDPAARLAEIETRTDAAFQGCAQDDPAFAAIALVTRECGIPLHYIEDLIEGFALDAEDWRPRTLGDLLDYCYHVAGSVGCMMAIVMGVDSSDHDILDRACDLGIAFQLANIVRDIGEDAAASRCYLPTEWLAEMDIPPDDPMEPEARHRLAALVVRLTDLAARYEESARAGAPVLPFRSSWAVLSAAGIYGAIARQVAAKGQRAWDTRQFIGRPQKIAFVIRGGWTSLIRNRLYRPGPRDQDLWRRPRRF